MRRSTIVLSILALLGLIARAPAALIGPTPVALPGDAAPAGGTYSGFFSDAGPLLSSSGQVAFFAGVSGGNGGLFAGAPGSLQTAALNGAASPAGGTYIGFFLHPVLNGSGQVAFSASVTQSGTPFQARAIFVGAPGSVQTAALQFTDAPAGGNYNFFGDPALNASGQVAFNASLTGGSSTQGLFAGAPGSVQAVALQGAAAPAGGNYSNFSLAVLNTSGQVAFTSNLTGGASSRGIFAGAAGSVQTVALESAAAPAGGNYATLSFNPGFNDAGQVAFSTTLTGGTFPSGIFAGSPGSVQAVALQGNAAPAGGNFGSLNSAPVLNAAGQVAFAASLTGGTSTNGIFAGAPGSLQSIALQGAAAPDGVGNFDALATSIALNASGQVAFTASLSGVGVSAANDNGLYVGSGAAGSLTKIVREGDLIDIDPSALVDLRTVNSITFTPGSGGQDGRAMGFNDAGLLVYRLTFSDNQTINKSGIFTSQLAVVPEPASLAMLATGAGMLLRSRASVRGGRRPDLAR